VTREGVRGLVVVVVGVEEQEGKLGHALLLSPAGGQAG
jgi:hypothetical protein